jgi:hypothetical protein
LGRPAASGRALAGGELVVLLDEVLAQRLAEIRRTRLRQTIYFDNGISLLSRELTGKLEGSTGMAR